MNNQDVAKFEGQKVVLLVEKKDQYGQEMSLIKLPEKDLKNAFWVHSSQVAKEERIA